jgi:hypothetical protein
MYSHYYQKQRQCYGLSSNLNTNLIFYVTRGKSSQVRTYDLKANNYQLHKYTQLKKAMFLSYSYLIRMKI